jgi:prepilin-type N-terminal cleavage/methylation domain-containing protein
MKMTQKHRRRGFTLIELSIAIMLGLAISAMTLGLFNQQLAFLKIYQSQSFLTEEAPIVGMYVSKLVGKADRFHLHGNLADAISGAAPNNGPSDFAVLNFRQPNGTIRSAVLAFQSLNGTGTALYYYVVPLGFAGGLPAPQWAIMRPASGPNGQVRRGNFTVLNGNLQMNLIGENNERITYCGSM